MTSNKEGDNDLIDFLTSYGNDKTISNSNNRGSYNYNNDYNNLYFNNYQEENNSNSYSLNYNSINSNHYNERIDLLDDNFNMNINSSNKIEFEEILLDDMTTSNISSNNILSGDYNKSTIANSQYLSNSYSNMNQSPKNSCWRTYSDQDEDNQISQTNYEYNNLISLLNQSDDSPITLYDSNQRNNSLNNNLINDFSDGSINNNIYINTDDNDNSFADISSIKNYISNYNTDTLLDVNCVEIDRNEDEITSHNNSNSSSIMNASANSKNPNKKSRFEGDHYTILSENDLDNSEVEIIGNKSIISDQISEFKVLLNATLSNVLTKANESLDESCKYIFSTLKTNPWVANATGCAMEAILFATERMRYLSEECSYILTSDDPETQYLKELRDGLLGGGWKSLLHLYQRHITLTRQQRLLIGIESNQSDRYIVESADNGNLIESLDLPKDIDLKQLIDEADKAADAVDDCDAEYILSRYVIPPPFKESNQCVKCLQTFSILLYRHHCRCCGLSFCNNHSLQRRRILHFGITTNVRVCDDCAKRIDNISLHDDLNWKSTRIKDYLSGNLIPYQNPLVDRTIDKVYRVADYSLQFVKNTLYLSFPAKIAIETLDILKRYGISGLAGVLLRQEFVEAVETLKRISGLEKKFPMSLHVLTACIYYKLAVDRFLRGCYPEDEHNAHSPVVSSEQSPPTTSSLSSSSSSYISDSKEDKHSDNNYQTDGNNGSSNYNDSDLKDAIKFAPLALRAAYMESLVESQRLAGLQGWELIYGETISAPERPAYSLFGTDIRSFRTNKSKSNHDDSRLLQHGLGDNHINKHVTKQPTKQKKEKITYRKEIVLAIRGTHTIQDVVTDIRASPVEFPPVTESYENNSENSWVLLTSGKNYACGGMVRAALWLKSVVGPSLMEFSKKKNCDIIIVGHSLGGGVAALLTYLLMSSIPSIRCITYGCPSCLTAEIADELKSKVLTIVLHDDVISRITPKSIRHFINDLMIFRENISGHLTNDWNDVIARAGSLWSPRWRDIQRKDPLVLDSYESDYEHVSNFDNESMASSLPLQTKPLKAIITEPNDDIVLVDVDEIMELWLPGRIMHIYSHRGQYKAMMVDRTFESLRKIQLQGNMFKDHSSESITNALHEVIAVKGAVATPPPWCPYNSTDNCKCCENKFTWHSTFTGIAQEYREKFNCRYCGLLVCDPCSQKRYPIAKYGLIFPSRICDKCVLKGDFATVI